VEGEPLRGPLAHTRQPRQLCDEILDRRAEHSAIVPGQSDVAQLA